MYLVLDEFFVGFIDAHILYFIFLCIAYFVILAMSFFKKKPQGAAELRLASHRQSARAWLSDEDITGCAVFKLPPGVKFSHSKILLKGMAAPTASAGFRSP